MALRCFVFSEDQSAAALIRQILDGLGVEAEYCADAVVAAEKITTQAVQIVVIDWDKQPEAGVMLNTARERKAVERPLTLAIVSDDKSVPGVLQAGANSILRKPIVLNQAKDTLTMARDLIRAKQESAAGTGHAAAAAAAAAASSVRSSLPVSAEAGERTLRAGEFLQSGPAAPGGQFETDADISIISSQSSAQIVDPLKDLEPVAASVAERQPEQPPPPPAPGEVRGLEWYKNRIAARQPAQAPAPAPAAKSASPELLGYDQTSSYSPPSAKLDPNNPDPVSAPKASVEKRDAHREDPAKEAALFAYIDGERSEPEKISRPRLALGKNKKTIIGALVLAASAIIAAPQAPWHSNLESLGRRGQQSLHAWLNPQPVTPVQAPAAHEDFAVPGDEYKLPAAEPIPDATTDPSQIQVVPVVDPTVKKPNGDAASPDQTAVQGAGSSAVPSDQASTPTGQTPAAPIPGSQPAQAVAVPAQPASGTPAPVSAPSPAPAVTTVSMPPHSDAPAPTTPTPAVSTPAVPRNSPPRNPTIPGNVPSSLQTQLAPAGDAGGNKPADTAMDSIEPVQVSESAERALLADQAAIVYPDSAKGQQGTVILQVLVARDGTVQDAKFLQGSLAFARAAIEGVKQWKFKPYVMNGRPVSVQTQLTMKFNPGQ